MLKDSLARLWARCKKEPYPGLLGIEVLEIEPGYARVAMQFEPGMENIFGMLHGGAVFSSPRPGRSTQPVKRPSTKFVSSRKQTTVSWRRPRPWPTEKAAPSLSTITVI